LAYLDLKDGMLRVVPKVLTSGAREETQFGLFGHGRITDSGESDPSAPAAVITMATRYKPSTKRGRLSVRLPKNVLQIPT